MALVTAVAQVRSLAQELLHAAGAAGKKKKTKLKDPSKQSIQDNLWVLCRAAQEGWVVLLVRKGQ